MTISTPQMTVKTRIMVLSDTHGSTFNDSDRPLRTADVVIHCGDLTEESKLEEFADALKLLRDIDAPLKLVIAGNHDFTLDTHAFQKKVSDSKPALEPELVRKSYGEYGQARIMMDDAQSTGIMFLDEGHHQFTLTNGACLTVYASPWTPARGDWNFGDWGFQYQAGDGHNFDIHEGVDLVMTHGPPKGIMDMTADRKRAGCPDLFQAVARAHPRLHCFGHIHSGWGAKLVTWREQLSEEPSHFTDIDNDQSTLIDNLGGFKASKLETEEEKVRKLGKAGYYRDQRCYPTTHCSGDELSLQYGHQTLFVNASVEADEGPSLQLPWFVEIDLPLI